jgi:glycosyltransferase involved in cell wall biosynthesis
MTDVQAALIALPCRVLGIRHVLWYAHKSPSVFLRICYPLINVLVTSTVGSCPLTGRKLVYLGQGIDSSIVKFSKKEPSFPPKNWYHVGRLDPAKNIEKIIESLATFREKYVNTELHLYGSYSSQQYEKYAQSMIQRYSNFNWIHFHGVIPNSKVPLITSEHDGFIHAYLGSLDKALVEAVFLNRFIVSANPEYILQFQSRSPGGLTVEEELVGQLQSVYSMTKDEYMSKIREIYRIAEQNHSLSGWIERLVQILSVKSS